MKDKKIFHFLRNTPLRNIPLYHRIRFAKKERRIRASVTRRGEDFNKLRPLLLESMVKYHWDTDEFFMYHYTDLTPEERSSFVPEYEKNVFCDKVNDLKSSKIFESKWKSYETFKEFYGRDCCVVTESLLNAKDEKLMTFLSKQRSFILKPDTGSLGQGISIIRSKDIDDALSSIMSIIRGKKDAFVLEELIQQSSEMSVFHPQSINTVRLRVFRFDDRMEVLPSNFRIGRGDSIVDNTGHGGISAALNENGVVVAACDSKGNKCETHPDSGMRIIGFQIPRWDEAIELAKKLCLVVPKVRYVGWDLALTDKGWVVIEGNDKGMFEGIQITLQKGFRPYLDKILAEMNIKL